MTRLRANGQRTRGRIAALAVQALFLMLPGCRQSSTVHVPVVPRGFVEARPVAPLFDPNMASARLEGPARDRWQQPERIVEALHLRAGDTVADIGSGTGYLLPYLSHAVGAKGHVVAEEIQDGFLAGLHHRAKLLHNVEVTLGTAEDPNLPSGNVSAFVLLTVYHEVDHPVDFLRTLRKYACPDARLAIIDFDANRKGDPTAPAEHQVAESAVIQEARAAGWELAGRHDFISSQFFLVFRPAR